MKKTMKYLMAISLPLLAAIVTSCSDDVKELWNINDECAATIEVADITRTSAIVTVKVSNVSSYYSGSLIYSKSRDFSVFEEVWSGGEWHSNGLDYVFELTELEPGTEYFIKFKVGGGGLHKAGISIIGDSMSYVESSFTTLGTIDTDINYVAVDMGISVKWAQVNIGATNEHSVGNYFYWGDPTGSATSSVDTDNLPTNIAGTTYDVATAIMGDNWMMPTLEQWNELFDATVQEEETLRGQKGLRFYAKNGNTIFIPYGGYKNGYAYGDGAYLWTSDMDVSSGYGYYVNFTMSGHGFDDINYWQLPVRAVTK